MIISSRRASRRSGRYQTEAGLPLMQAKSPSATLAWEMQPRLLCSMPNDCGSMDKSSLATTPAIHVEVPSSDGTSNRFCFIGRHEDVARVLENRESADEPGRPEFSVRQYRDNGRGITRGSDFVIGTEELGSTAPTRIRLHAILEKAWRALARSTQGAGHCRLCTRRCPTCFGGRSAANGQRAAD